MARKKSLLSSIIELFMSHLTFYFKIRELLKLMAVNDSLDDKRRENIRKLENLFFKQIRIAIKKRDFELIETLVEKFIADKLADYIIENKFETNDDQIREKNIKATSEAIERTSKDTEEYQIKALECM